MARIRPLTWRTAMRRWPEHPSNEGLGLPTGIARTPRLAKSSQSSPTSEQRLRSSARLKQSLSIVLMSRIEYPLSASSSTGRHGSGGGGASRRLPSGVVIGPVSSSCRVSDAARKAAYSRYLSSFDAFALSDTPLMMMKPGRGSALWAAAAPPPPSISSPMAWLHDCVSRKPSGHQR